jgi:coproporphyrinogen III oxidase
MSENYVMTDRQRFIVDYLKTLREKIIVAFEGFEHGRFFSRNPWPYEKGWGGGEIGLLRGDVFEKGAVNCSVIHGPNFPMSDGDGAFFAAGVSLITHMMNPHAPTVHFNIRYIETTKQSWFGGGFDLTPMGFFYDEDTKHFHSVAKKSLDAIDPALYEKFSQQAKDYFYIPHRKKERGVGGIFFDHVNSGNFEKDLMMWQAVGNGFLDTIMPIYERRIRTPYDAKDKEKQLCFRAHYVEFNLLYDRGTKFGFLSGGNPDAILCSMPPLAAW